MFRRVCRTRNKFTTKPFKKLVATKGCPLSPLVRRRNSSSLKIAIRVCFPNICGTIYMFAPKGRSNVLHSDTRRQCCPSFRDDRNPSLRAMHAYSHDSYTTVCIIECETCGFRIRKVIWVVRCFRNICTTCTLQAACAEHVKPSAHRKVGDWGGEGVITI